MNRFIRSLIAINLMLVCFTCFTFCSKDDAAGIIPTPNAPTGQVDDRVPFCTLSFTSNVPIAVCGTQSNSTTCTALTGAVLTGYETGYSGNYSLQSNSLISFSSPSGTANVSISCGGTTYDVVISPGEPLGVQLYKSCKVAFVY